MSRRLVFSLAALLTATVGSSAPGPKPPRVIVVGWDGADWSLLDPLMKEGKLPHLSQLVSRGRTYDLSTFEPMASPLIWTTIATGRTPVDHGVADFQENDPKSRMSIPVTSRSRKVPAIWNAASARGLRVGVVGWWATWPAEKVNGFLVSDRIAPVLFDPETLAGSPALTWPEGIAEGARLILKREGSPPYGDVAQGLTVSRAEFDAAVAAGKDLEEPITGYRKILGATRVIGRIALDLYDREKPDLLMAYFQGTDEIGHVLGRFRPPRRPPRAGRRASSTSRRRWRGFSPSLPTRRGRGGPLRGSRRVLRRRCRRKGGRRSRRSSASSPRTAPRTRSAWPTSSRRS